MDELALTTLQRMQGLKALSAPCLQAIADAGKPIRVEAGRSVFTHLEQSADVYYIASGQVRVHMSAVNGRALTYQILPAGEMFGELAAIDRQPRTASAIAETECLLIKLPAGDFNHLVADHSDFAQLVFAKLARMNRWLIERLFEYHTYDVRGRVYAELLRATNNERQTVVVTDKDLASRVGTTRENVTRIHSDLKQQGVVRRTSSTLTVLDRERLKEMLKDREFG